MYYTTIIHPIRKSLHLSCNEYCVLDSIYKLQNNESHWCYKSRENMAKDLDLSKQTIITIIKNLIVRGLVMQNDITKHLRVTNEIFPKLLNDHKTLEYNRKENSFTIGIETLPDESRNFTKNGKETLPYNNIYNDNNNTNKIYKDKDDFINKLEPFKDKLGNQYQSFIDYWTEADAKGKMRYQDQKFFDIGRRIGTWVKNSKNFEPINTTNTKIKLP